MTRDACLSRVERIVRANEPGFPVFIDVANTDDYRLIRETLEEYCGKQMSIADFIREDVAVDLGNVLVEVRNSIDGVLVTGLSAYLHLRSKEEAVGFILDTEYCVTGNGPCFVLTYGMRGIFTEFERNHPNPCWKERFFVIGDNPADGYGSYVFFDEELKGVAGTFQGAFANSLQSFIRGIDCEPANWEGSCVNKTQLENLARTRRFRILRSPFDLLEFCCRDMPPSVKSDMGSDSQWIELIPEVLEAKTWTAFFRRKFGEMSLEEVLASNWSRMDASARWFLFLGLKASGASSPYLQKVLESSLTVQAFIERLYSAILSVDVSASEFRRMYDERKKLLAGVKDSTALKTFVELSKGAGRNRLFYMTDLSLDEQKAVLECLFDAPEHYAGFASGEYRHIFPALADYATRYDFSGDDGKLAKYFADYRRQKVCNRVEPEFLAVVADEATRRSYNLLATRDSVFSKAYNAADGVKVIWVDALGAEFLPYLKRKAVERGLIARMSFGRANVPTITDFNKLFLKDIPHEVTKRLDNLKHDGDEAFNNDRKLPFYLIKELQILDEVMDHVHGCLTAGAKRVIVVSDHGATRLPVVLGRERLTHAMESKGRHGGRCCEALPTMADSIPEATKENGYFVLADYNRFKGGNAGQFENHGGATLEEVIAPVIEFSLGEVRYQAYLANPKISVVRGRTATVKISVAPSPQTVSVRIGDRVCLAKPVVGATGQFEILIDEEVKTGEYEIAVIADNDELADRLKLVVMRGGVVEKKLF